VPAVIYGHGADPRHVALPAREFANAIRHGGANVLLTLDLEDGEQLAIAKSIQRHPLKGYFEHVDLLAVRRGEKVTVDVPLNVVGDAAPGGLLTVEHATVSVEAEATHLPTEFQVDITDLAVGAHVTAGDLNLPNGVSLAIDAETVLLIVAEAPSAEQLEAQTAEAAGELGIVEEQPAAETAEAPAEAAAE
jgi:large subunit ribosomal protein L25